jgi:ketosteroid isomerase-like protein
VYHFFVRRHVGAIFRRLNQGDYEFVLAQFRSGAEHWFSGSHALAGRRQSPEARRAWYGRLSRVFPRIQFELQKVVVSGWPWRTQVAIEWRDRALDTNGVELPNRGVFVATLRWGKVDEFHVYCDTQALAKNLEIVGGQGRTDALAPPIEG